LSKLAANARVCSTATSLAYKQGNSARERGFGLRLSKKGKEKAAL
jgi:hypothetical protein